MGTTWKQFRIGVFKRRYEKYLEEYSTHTDDRRVFCNIYHMVIEALESLPEEPNTYVKIAINRLIGEDEIDMDQILNWFKYGIPHEAHIMDDVRKSAEGIFKAYCVYDLDQQDHCRWLREDLMHTYHLSKYNAGRLVREVIRFRKEVA